MRCLTYNVHRCRGLDGLLAPERIAQVIAGTRAEVVCLQELDAGHRRTGGVHQAAAISEVLSMHFHFFPAIRGTHEEYGDAILSRHPLSVVRTGQLPRPHGALEPRGAIWVEIEAEGARWQVLTTHLGLGRDERLSQATALAEWIQAASMRPPVVFCGDLNSHSTSRVHSRFSARLHRVTTGSDRSARWTFATWFPWICLDYIYVSPDVAVRSAEVVSHPLARLASDHFPVLAELACPL